MFISFCLSISCKGTTFSVKNEKKSKKLLFNKKRENEKFPSEW